MYCRHTTVMLLLDCEKKKKTMTIGIEVTWDLNFMVRLRLKKSIIPGIFDQ